MKKFLAILLLCAMSLSLAACGDKNKAASSEITDALELLSTVWASYNDNEKFAIIGGDFSEENSKTDAPGKFALDNAEIVDASLGLPAEAVAKVDDCASMIHMMNANTFTAAAYHVADYSESNALAVVEAIKDNVLARQWMCGFPDKVVIITVGEYVVSAFGNGEAVDGFVAKVTEAYADAVVACDEPIL